MPEIFLEMDILHADQGWMDCWLVVDGQRHHLDATGVFPPFGELLRFVHAIFADALPHQFYWEEEGHGADFRALPAASGGANFRLQVKHDGQTIVDAELNRQQSAEALLEALRRFALDCPEAETDWQFPYFLIEAFERQRAGGFAEAGSDPFLDANFVFEHFRDQSHSALLPIVLPDSIRQSAPAFHLWVGDQRMLYLQMGAGPRLWQQWLGLLGKIARAELPVEMVFDWRSAEENEADEPGFLALLAFAHGLRAEPTAQPGQFRLVLWPIAADIQIQDQRPYLNARLARRQFVNAFVQAFAMFLSTDYQAYLEGNPQGFDLRSLALEGLA